MQTSNRLNHIVLSLIDYWYLWVIPCLVGGGMAIFYSLFLHTPTYTARQSLIVRDDLLGDAFKPSRFESMDSLKSAQETILEIARKPEVIRNVMEQLGTPGSFLLGARGIGDRDIEEMQGNIEFGAPNGAEFGKTEAVVLKVTAKNREEAKTFTNLLLDEIDTKLSDVRRQRLKSMEKELALASDKSRKLLTDASRELQQIERGFGTEITTIRGLNDPQGGNSFDLKLNQIRLEKRQAVALLASAREQKSLLESAESNGSLELVTSSQLLELQPALRGMMDSLNKARETLSVDEGRYKSLHPALKASREAVRHQKEMLFNSLGTAIAGLDSQIAMAERQVERLSQSILELEDRLLDLTEQRVPYHTLQEEVKNKSKVYSDVQAQLSQVQSYASSSESIALLTRVGQPQVGTKPNGLGKKALVMVGLAGGLLIGLGLVALAVPPSGNAVAYQPVMMPVGSGQAAYPANGVFQMPGHGGTEQPAATPVPTAAPTGAAVANVVNETVSESRLKSVAQMEQQRKQAGKAAAEAGKRNSTAARPASSASMMANALDSSVIPESVARHMAELKNKAKSASSRPPSSALPVAAPSTTPPQAAAPSTTAIPPAAARKAGNPTAGQQQPARRPQVSSADVIASLKKAQAKPADIAGTTPASPASAGKPGKPVDVKVGTGSTVAGSGAGATANTAQMLKPAAPAAQPKPEATPSKSADSIRDTLRSLEAFKEKQSLQSKLRTSETGAPQPPVAAQPDIVVVDRKTKTPDVPDAIAAGRITAESLIQSSERRVKGEADESDIPSAGASAGHARINVSSTPLDTSILQKVKAELEDPSKSSDISSTRIPSITDYARSLENPVDEVLANRNNGELANSTDTTLPLERRPANVRPVDIAKSLAENDSVRGIVDDIRPDETQAEATRVANQRATEATIPTQVVDNSLAGLMREARKSNPAFVSRQSKSDITPGEVQPSPKPRQEAKSSAAESAKTRTKAGTAAIPEQIRQLSDSISTFARPTGKTSN